MEEEEALAILRPALHRIRTLRVSLEPRMGLTPSIWPILRNATALSLLTLSNFEPEEPLDPNAIPDGQPLLPSLQVISVGDFFHFSIISPLLGPTVKHLKLSMATEFSRNTIPSAMLLRILSGMPLLQTVRLERFLGVNSEYPEDRNLVTVHLPHLRQLYLV